jgi:hypothetical protein
MPMLAEYVDAAAALGMHVKMYLLHPILVKTAETSFFRVS